MYDINYVRNKARSEVALAGTRALHYAETARRVVGTLHFATLVRFDESGPFDAVECSTPVRRPNCTSTACTHAHRSNSGAALSVSRALSSFLAACVRHTSRVGTSGGAQSSDVANRRTKT